MGQQAHFQVEVAPGAAADSLTTLAAQPDAATVPDTGRDLDLQRPGVRDLPGTAAA